MNDITQDPLYKLDNTFRQLKEEFKEEYAIRTAHLTHIEQLTIDPVFEEELDELKEAYDKKISTAFFELKKKLDKNKTFYLGCPLSNYKHTYYDRLDNYLSYYDDSDEYDFIEDEKEYLDNTLNDVYQSESSHDGYSITGHENFIFAYEIVNLLSYKQFELSTNKKIEFLEQRRSKLTEQKELKKQVDNIGQDVFKITLQKIDEFKEFIQTRINQAITIKDKKDVCLRYIYTIKQAMAFNPIKDIITNTYNPEIDNVSYRNASEITLKWLELELEYLNKKDSLVSNSIKMDRTKETVIKRVVNNLEVFSFFQITVIDDLEYNGKTYKDIPQRNNESIITPGNWDANKDIFFKQRMNAYNEYYTLDEKINLELKKINQLISKEPDIQILKDRYVAYLHQISQGDSNKKDMSGKIEKIHDEVLESEYDYKEKIKLLKSIWLAEPKISAEDFIQKGIDKGIWNESFNLITERNSIFGKGKILLGSMFVALKDWAIYKNIDHNKAGEVLCEVFNIENKPTTTNPYKSFSSANQKYISAFKQQFNIKNS